MFLLVVVVNGESEALGSSIMKGSFSVLLEALKPFICLDKSRRDASSEFTPSTII